MKLSQTTRNLHRTAPPDLRVSARFPLRLRTGHWSAGRWAQAIIARYTRRFWVTLGLNTQWRQARQSEISLPSVQQPQIFAPNYFAYAPHLRLTLLMHTAGESPASGLGSPASSSPWQVIRQPVVTAKIQTLLQRVYREEQVETSVSQPLIQQLALRHQRVETSSSMNNNMQPLSAAGSLTPNRARPNPPWSPPAAPPVPRVVHKATALPANTAGSASPAQTLGIAENTRAAQRISMQTPMVNGNPLDINRLTDQVMQQIDRRMLAHRERTGRV